MIEEEYGDEYGWLGDDCGGWGWLVMFFIAGGMAVVVGDVF